MSPSRGDGSTVDGSSLQTDASTDEIRAARDALRQLLKELHVLDALPERSRMLAVDAELQVDSILSTVLAEQHPQTQNQRSSTVHSGGCGTTEDASREGGGTAQMRREGVGAPEENLHAISVGIVSPALPSNVLAEVCEFEICGTSRSEVEAEKSDEDAAPQLRRQWTSPDDGWGMHLSSIPMQDLEKMPMGMPFTVGELADFLCHACSQTDVKKEAETGDAVDDDELDWSLSRWRAHHQRLQRQEHGEGGGEDDPCQADKKEAARLFIEESGTSAGPVLVHQAPFAPARPILCTDDPDASILKAVELLLAYPELDALPIVSPVRCTVVAHLTLSYCLAYILPKMRGADLSPLTALMVKGSMDGSPPTVRKFDASAYKTQNWAVKQSLEILQSPLVLTQSQTLQELLTFFAKTHHSGAPVIEENGSGGVLGLISRRDFLNYMDLAMQSEKRRLESSETNGNSEFVNFELGTSIEVLLQILRQYRPEAGPCVGATIVRDEELSLKDATLRLLAAENKKLLFVQAQGESKLLRIFSVSDLWRVLIGSSQERAGKLHDQDGTYEPQNL